MGELVVIIFVFIVVFGVGFVLVVYLYYKGYKIFVFWKMLCVFELGDFVLELVVIGKDIFYSYVGKDEYWVIWFE